MGIIYGGVCMKTFTRKETKSKKSRVGIIHDKVYKKLYARCKRRNNMSWFAQWKCIDNMAKKDWKNGELSDAGYIEWIKRW